MSIKKAIIPAAGLGTRFLPATKAQPKEMLPIVDKPTIQYIVEEAVEAGITDILIVTGKGKNCIEDHFDKAPELERQLEEKGKTEFLEVINGITDNVNIHYIRQKEAKGLANAIYCAKSFVGREPFAILLGDIIIETKYPFLARLINTFERYNSPIIGVEEVDMKDVSKYGIIDGKIMDDRIFKIDRLVEKPSIEMAPSNIAILGRYVLTSDIFNIIEKLPVGKNGEYQLTDALQELLKTRPLYACECKGKKYDIGSKVGFLEANIDFALKRPDLRDEVLEYMKNVLKKEEITEEEAKENIYI
ncbi:MAG: UTP--glucose-1-phosphate uridylyltransferase GalU [Clostridiales bacterium]|nr:UTP--glucose-1-phosphate uridylyltransferase GalU [Clostridiales bacterium]